MMHGKMDGFRMVQVSGEKNGEKLCARFPTCQIAAIGRWPDSFMRSLEECGGNSENARRGLT
jgi:hypothetical protein